MIQKIKDLMKMNEQVDLLKDKIDLHNKRLEELNNEIFHFKNVTEQRVTDILKNSEDLITTLSKEIKDISELKKDLIHEITDFKLQKTQVLKKVMEQSNDEFKEHLDRVKTDASRYNEVKNEFGSITNQIDEVKNEVNKFINISKKIKEEDYELTKHANKLMANDKEKLELMAKIDHLERLISSERRKKR